MDKYQLQGLINLLEQYRHEYDLDSATAYVHVAYLIKDIEERLPDATGREAER